MFIEKKYKAQDPTNAKHNNMLTTEEFNALVREDLALIALTDDPSALKENQIAISVQKLSSGVIYKDIGFVNSIVLKKEGLNKQTKPFIGMSGFFTPRFENNNNTILSIAGYDGLPCYYKGELIPPNWFQPGTMYMFYFTEDRVNISLLSSTENSEISRSVTSYTETVQITDNGFKTTYNVLTDLINPVCIVTDKDDPELVIGEVVPTKTSYRDFTLDTAEFNGHFITISYLRVL